MARVEPRIHLPQRNQRADEQRGANQQHQSHRNLGHHQAVPRPVPASRSRPGTALLHRRVHVRARNLQRREQTEDHSRQNRHAHRESQHAPIQRGRVRKFRRAGKVAGTQRHQRPRAPRAHHESRGAAQHGQQQALRQQLPYNPPPSRSQRRADRDFAGSVRRPGQQKVRHVRARNQQHHAHR